MSLSQLTVYGAGLIGGSIALCARKHRLAQRIVAIEQQRPAMNEAVFDDWAISSAERERALRQAEVVMLCVPVRTIIDQLPLVLAQTDGIVTDCGSTKAAICRAVIDHKHRARFVAGHPMAGHPEGGLANASADLFVGRRWILCPEGSSTESLARVEDLIKGTGAEVVSLQDTEHDASVAWTSHLPQVMASALSVYAHRNHALQAAGPGFASATRVAGGAEAMWGDIFTTNAASIGRSLVEVGEALAQLGRDLERGETESTLGMLAAARPLRAPKT